MLNKKWQEILKKYLPKSIPDKTDDMFCNIRTRCKPYIDANMKAKVEYRKWKKNLLKGVQESSS